ENPISERLKAPLSSDGGAGAALGFVGQIEVFQLGLGVRAVDTRLQLGGELALALDLLAHRLLARVELAEVGGAGGYCFEGHLVEVAGRLLAVAGDEGKSGSGGKEFEGALDLLDLE